MTRTHGMRGTPEYRAWCNIKARCTDQNRADWSRYGGKGIKMCSEWSDSFEKFYRDIGPRPSPRHSIDRIDGARGYEPGNCRWASLATQSRNRGVVIARQLPPHVYKIKTRYVVYGWAKNSVVGRFATALEATFCAANHGFFALATIADAGEKK